MQPPQCCETLCTKPSVFCVKILISEVIFEAESEEKRKVLNTEPELAVKSSWRPGGTGPMPGLGCGRACCLPNSSFHLSRGSGGNSYCILPCVAWTSWSSWSMKVWRPSMKISHSRFTLFGSYKSVLIMDLQVACHNPDIPCRSRGPQRSRSGGLELGLALGWYVGQ